MHLVLSCVKYSYLFFMLAPAIAKSSFIISPPSHTRKTNKHYLTKRKTKHSKSPPEICKCPTFEMFFLRLMGDEFAVFEVDKGNCLCHCFLRVYLLSLVWKRILLSSVSFRRPKLSEGK